MERITTVAGLRNAIKVLEIEHSAEELLLKDQFHLVYESLKPANIIKSTLKDIISSSTSYFPGSFSGTAIGAASGFLLKKFFVGSSGNVFKKLIGNLLQVGVTNIAARKSDTINSLGQSLLQRIFHRKERNTEESDE